MTMALALTATGRSARLAVSTLQLARWAFLRYLRSPQLSIVGTVQMAGFLLIYRYVLGGALAIPGMSVVDYLVPGFVATGVLFSGIGSATEIADNLQQGFVDRLRSLPIPRVSFLAGRALADTAFMAWGLLVATGVGFAVGFRIHGSVGGALAAFGLCVLFGFAFEWFFITLGLMAGKPQAAQGMALIVFPFTFLSSAYVPVRTMPGPLQAFAAHQPITDMVNAVRTLAEGHAAETLLGHSAAYWTIRSFLWALALVVVFIPLAASRYRRS
jgi:ABC transporter DrrB family efflux protein